uniref:Uncharacterized protein n=1 Tax=Lactuca sativa TaxID=4236 RepID=A0A9R1X2S7_LACSA|nr:hypothetical protein LSAT_V11C700366760 [Lactuca sativa]
MKMIDPKSMDDSNVSDQNNSDDDADIPYFSDVEAMLGCRKILQKIKIKVTRRATFLKERCSIEDDAELFDVACYAVILVLHVGTKLQHVIATLALESAANTGGFFAQRRLALFQVPLLVGIGEDDTALTKATESGDTDLVYLVLFHILQKDVAYLLWKESWELAKNPMATRGSPLHTPLTGLVHVHSFKLSSSECITHVSRIWNYEEATLVNNFSNHECLDKGISKLFLVNELDESLLLVA